MAPRGRTRKVGLTRADAARDAMKAFGFKMRLINETIKELLKVYGEEGWVLIEEASYKVLLDAILEKVEEEGKAERQDRAEEEHAEDRRGQMGSNSTSQMDVEPERNPNQGTGIGTQTYHVDALSFTDEVVVSSLARQSEGPQEPHPVGQPAHHPVRVAIEIGGSSKAKETENVGGNTEVDGNDVVMEEGLRDSVRTAKRSPLHNHNGWLSSEEEEEEDDDDEDTYVLLTPEPLSEDLRRLLMEAKAQRKRKTRWDVPPEEMNLMGASPPASSVKSEA